MKKIIAIVSIVAFLSACAGTPARPVPPYQYGDEKKDCDLLYQEALACKTQIQERIDHRNGKIAANVMIVIVGIAIFPLLLFAIDSKSDEVTEMHALATRQETLRKIGTDNDCGWCSDETMLTEITFPELPPVVPVVEEQSNMLPGTGEV
ncbi:MAG: hypothetical protein VR64_07275 [Desulfatitalea sp. BRH_c12]|jgi:hypothetical protein|nr:MAG: hypothetical protein VR64_07275 [Desulfatitalea sp. BRH_c12]